MDRLIAPRIASRGHVSNRGARAEAGVAKLMLGLHAAKVDQAGRAPPNHLSCPSLR